MTMKIFKQWCLCDDNNFIDNDDDDDDDDDDIVHQVSCGGFMWAAPQRLLISRFSSTSLQQTAMRRLPLFTMRIIYYLLIIYNLLWLFINYYH